jgi:hypothetical protein
LTCGFDEAMALRMRTSKSEATREVLTLAKTMYIGDAVALVIESMPRQKTAQLRRWNDSWDGWCKWIEWLDKGWDIRRVSAGIVTLVAPFKLRTLEEAKNVSNRPSDESVAAALDVGNARFLGVNRYSSDRNAEFLYKIRAAIL